MRLAGDATATEGVTLSGVRKDRDCKLTELWRNPFGWVPKVQGACALISQAKGQSYFSYSLFIFGRIAFMRNSSILFLGG